MSVRDELRDFWDARPPLLAMTAGATVGWAAAMALSKLIGWW